MSTRVMLVDDAVVVRHILRDTLSADPELEIVAVARDGHDALAKLDRARPDVVVLDVEMPNMDGIETLVAIKASFPAIKVIMFSTLTSRGAAATMDALMAGADDYVTKPANVGSITAAITSITTELSPRIKALHRPAAFVERDQSRVLADNVSVRSGRSSTGATPSTGRSSVGKVQVVVIGVSTGGPNALMELLPQLPSTFPVPIAIVQHIPPMFSKALADRLDAKCALHVSEATPGNIVHPGEIVIAPGGHHITLSKTSMGAMVSTNEDAPENSCRPAADVLFRSAVNAFGADVLGVVLTGMGNDGTKGSAEIVRAGGSILIQDEDSSVVWGMPGSIAASGIPFESYSLRELASEIVHRVKPIRTNSGKQL